MPSFSNYFRVYYDTFLAAQAADPSYRLQVSFFNTKNSDADSE